MKKADAVVTRREFLKTGTVVAVGLAAGLPSLAEELAAPFYTSRIILIRDKNAVGPDGAINGEILQKMLDDAVCAFFEIKTPLEGWKKIIKPEDIVGIKSNVWKYLPTPSALEDAIRTRLMEVGVDAADISVDDRNVLNNPVFQKATALINIRPMRTHSWSGVGSLIKNYIMFVEEPSDYHDNSCAPLGAIWHLPHVKDKTRLNILVMLTPQFHNAGPHHFDKEYIWNYGGLIVSNDPVAADTVGLRIIQKKRKRYYGDDRPLRPAAHHIAIAGTKYNLGTSDLSKIEIVRLGWMEESLI